MFGDTLKFVVIALMAANSAVAEEHFEDENAAVENSSSKSAILSATGRAALPSTNHQTNSGPRAALFQIASRSFKSFHISSPRRGIMNPSPSSVRRPSISGPPRVSETTIPSLSDPAMWRRLSALYQSPAVQNLPTTEARIAHINSQVPAGIPISSNPLLTTPGSAVHNASQLSASSLFDAVFSADTNGPMNGFAVLGRWQNLSAQPSVSSFRTALTGTAVSNDVATQMHTAWSQAPTSETTTQGMLNYFSSVPQRQLREIFTRLQGNTDPTNVRAREIVGTMLGDSSINPADRASLQQMITQYGSRNDGLWGQLQVALQSSNPELRRAANQTLLSSYYQAPISTGAAQGLRGSENIATFLRSTPSTTSGQLALQAAHRDENGNSIVFLRQRYADGPERIVSMNLGRNPNPSAVHGALYTFVGSARHDGTNPNQGITELLFTAPGHTNPAQIAALTEAAQNSPTQNNRFNLNERNDSQPELATRQVTDIASSRALPPRLTLRRIEGVGEYLYYEPRHQVIGGPYYGYFLNPSVLDDTNMVRTNESTGRLELVDRADFGNYVAYGVHQLSRAGNYFLTQPTVTQVPNRTRYVPIYQLNL